MIGFYLGFSILTSTLIFAVFKLFDRRGVHNMSAIIVNYLVAFSLGFALNTNYDWASIIFQDWFPFAVVLGFIFITVFNVMAKTSQIHGVSVASVSTKMSLVIPVVAAFYLYGDPVTVLKVIGLCLAVLGVIMVSNPKMKTNQRLKAMHLPILLFLGSGFIDAYIKFNQAFFLSSDELEPFITTVFLVAGIVGVIFATFRKSGQWNRKNFIWGIFLGVPNYGSMYFLLKTLDFAEESSVIFPINNMGIVALSALVSFFVFREPLGKWNWIGIAVSIVAIFVFAWPYFFGG